MRKTPAIKIIALVIILTGGFFSNLIWASNVLFIVDISGRMSGKFPKYTKLSDPTKMQIATEAFESLLTALPDDINVGLEVYGHHGDKDCSAVEILNPVLPLDKTAIMDNIQKLVPERGSTPLAKALQQAAKTLGGLAGNRSIVIFSDGKDSCGGKPDEVAKNFVDQGITIHVIGLDVKNDETAQLSAIAEAGGGVYHAVNNAEDLQKSLASIKEKIIDQKRERKVFFRDDFNAETLADQWTLLNPDKNRITVKDGAAIILITASKAAKAKNILHLAVPTPEDDWIFTANFSLVPQSMTEIFELGVSNQKDSQQILGQIHIKVADNGISNVFLRGIKDTRQSSSHFYKKLISSSKNRKQPSEFFKKHVKSMTLQLQKAGTEYIVSAKLNPLKEGDKAISSEWVTLQKIISAPLSNDTFFIRTYLKDIKNYRTQTKSAMGEVKLNWVEVESMKHSENIK